MLAYNPGVYDRSGEIIAEGANRASEIQMQSMSNMGENIGNFIAQIGDAYSERKQLEAKASSYDDIGKILGTAMFSNNPDAMGALGNLQKEKDPRKKVMGYETLFSLVGPVSNAMMAQRNAGIRQDQQALTAAMPGIRAGAENAADVAGGQRTYSPPNLMNVVPAPTPAGFSSINQGMPGAAQYPQRPIGTRPMAVRPGGS